MNDGPRRYSTASLLFLTAATNRSGTNFLFDLLLLHPMLAAPEWLEEDFLALHATALTSYVTTLDQHWGEGETRGLVQRPDGAHLALARKLGEAIAEWGWDQVGESRIPAFSGAGQTSGRSSPAEAKFLLLKTPRIPDVEVASQIFPEARFVMIVRDPRAVAFSGARSFGGTSARWARQWQDAMTRYGVTYTGTSVDDRVISTRYEDLVRDPVGSVGDLLSALNLPADLYPFDLIEHLPVRGSSDLRGGSNEVHWRPQPRTAAFKPLSRSEQLGPWERAKIETVAREGLETWGYSQRRQQYSWRSYLVRLEWSIESRVRRSTTLLTAATQRMLRQALAWVAARR